MNFWIVNFSVPKSEIRASLETLLARVGGWDSSVDIATGYGLNGRGFVVLFQARAGDDSLLNSAQT
jgi:hypothetical protein